MLDHLVKRKITHILSVTAETTLWFPDQVIPELTFPYSNLKQIKYLHLRVYDSADELIIPHFEEAFKFIEEALANGTGVLVHCMAGMSRSASIVRNSSIIYFTNFPENCSLIVHKIQYNNNTIVPLNCYILEKITENTIQIEMWKSC